MHSYSITERNLSLMSNNNSDDGESCDLSNNLSELIKESYSSGETDGVQDAFSTNNVLSQLSAAVNLDAEEVAKQLVGAAIDAAGTNRGRLAAMINAILASCCECGDDGEDGSNNTTTSHPRIAVAILDHIDDLNSVDATTIVEPDIVSFSLVYYALQTSEQNSKSPQSTFILERAQRLAKKVAGSQRRRALAAERRRGGNAKEIDAEKHLQSLFGKDICILHETDDLIVVSKPSGVVCYHTKKTTAGKITASRKKKGRSESTKGGAKQMVDISLVDALLDIPISLSTVNPTARGITHRIDRGTSGTIVLAKTDEAHLKLVALFFLRKVKKKYLALVPGCSIGNENGSDSSVADDKKPLPLTMGSTGVIDASVGGRPAHSTYNVVGEYGKREQSSLPDALLLEINTLTGRKHQVRVHCASIGYPIFMDVKYWPSSKSAKDREKTKERVQKKKRQKSTTTEHTDMSILPNAIARLLDDPNQQQERFFLHASSLSVPELGIVVNAPLPSWWVDTMDQLN